MLVSGWHCTERFTLALWAGIVGREIRSRLPGRRGDWGLDQTLARLARDARRVAAREVGVKIGAVGELVGGRGWFRVENCTAARCVGVLGVFRGFRCAQRPGYSTASRCDAEVVAFGRASVHAGCSFRRWRVWRQARAAGRRETHGGCCDLVGCSPGLKARATGVKARDTKVAVVTWLPGF